MIAHPWVVAFSGFVLLMMMSTVVCLMVILTYGFHRLIAVRTFTFLHIGVVCDVCRNASFLSDAMATRHRVSDIAHYLDFRCFRETVLVSAQLYDAVTISRLLASWSLYVTAVSLRNSCD